MYIGCRKSNIKLYFDHKNKKFRSGNNQCLGGAPGKVFVKLPNGNSCYTIFTDILTSYILCQTEFQLFLLQQKTKSQDL